MSEQQPHHFDEIEGLLATRQQLIGWLNRLTETGARAPAAVRAKVEADYRARLAQVVAQISTHSDVIGSTLDGLRAQATEFRQLRAEEEEIRAEAELRHSVGEYTDDEWQLVELESSGKIDEFDQELGRLNDEIRRLAEVQGLITPESLAPVAPLRMAAPEPVEEPFVIQNPPMLDEPTPLALVRESEPLPPQPRPEAPRFVPRTGTPPAPSRSRESGPKRTIPITPAHAAHTTTSAAPQDELAFLRSVTIESPAPRAAPQPVPAAAVPNEREDRAGQASVKTLKCAECGSLNRPTEWYCERCGAELAAL
jgi:hypothetical protein